MKYLRYKDRVPADTLPMIGTIAQVEAALLHREMYPDTPNLAVPKISRPIGLLSSGRRTVGSHEKI